MRLREPDAAKPSTGRQTRNIYRKEPWPWFGAGWREWWDKGGTRRGQGRGEQVVERGRREGEAGGKDEREKEVSRGQRGVRREQSRGEGGQI